MAGTVGTADGSLADLVDVTGVLGDDVSPGALCELLRRLDRSLRGDGAVGVLVDDQCAEGVPEEQRAAVTAAIAGAPEGVSVLDVPGVGPLHAVVVALASGPDERIGVVRRSGPFVAREELLTRAVCRVLELTLSSTRAIRQLKERNVLLGVLRSVERSISEQSSLPETLQRITDGARQLFGQVVAGVVLRHDDRMELVAGAPRTTPPMIEYPMEIKHAARLHALLRGATVTEIPDYAAIPDPNPLMSRLGIRRVLIAPIRPGPEPLGCIMLSTADPLRRFSEDEREALRLLADHAGFAIDGARARQAVAESLEELERRAVTDDLTELLNRRGLFRAIEAAMRDQGPDAPLSALFIDLDRFKFVNDVYGHHVADRVLVEVARRLRAVSEDAIVGRLAGDEFVVLVPGDAKAAEDRAARIRASLEGPFVVDGACVHMGASVGVAAVNGHRTASQLLMDADLAMMEAKQQGRGRTVRYGAGLRASLDHRTALELSIREAMYDHRFELHFQPIVSLANGRTTSVEALLRWPELDGTHVRPAAVLGVAADAGLLPMLDLAIVRAALAELTEIRTRGRRGDLGVSVNITPATASLPDLADRILEEVRRAGVAPSSLTLELVETSAMDSDVTVTNLERLDAAGVAIALDNFGAGWSSLQRLQRVPLTYLKIDRAFVAGIGAGGAAEAIIQGLLQLAPAVNLKVVAEGVENEEQADWLRARGCGFGQGYQFGRPCPPEELAATLGGRHADTLVANR